MAKVLKKFRDKLDNYRIYDVGEEFKGERQEYLAELGFIETEEKKPTRKSKKDDE